MNGIFSKVADAVRLLSPSYKRHFTSALIMAAGTGSRMKAAGIDSKLLYKLCGTEVIARTLQVFEKSPYIHEIILVIREEEEAVFRKIAADYRITKLQAIAFGGETRQESVEHGFAKISPKAEYVAIHDGARCLVTQEMIEKVSNGAYRYGAAAAAQKATSTVKYADGMGFIQNTVDREHVWLAQTPQTIRTDIYQVALYTAKKDSIQVTDDCSLCEHLGSRVKLCDCGYENIKITTIEDIYMAEGILRSREESKS